MLRYFVLVIIAFCIVACGKSDPVTPVSPDQDRSSQWFPDPVQLFGDVNVCRVPSICLSEISRPNVHMGVRDRQFSKISGTPSRRGG